MDSDPMKLLNLSPIPELSEVELSAMFDQLSGLSDVNGDLTDRNVEDILKEAEDLIDKSYSSKDNKSTTASKNTDIATKNEIEMYSDVADANETIIEGEESSFKSEIQVSTENVQNDDISKPLLIPVEQTQQRIFSPGGSTNHIKSTIESLKEYSNMIEKQICSSSQSSSPKSKCKTDTRKKEKEDDSSHSKKNSFKDEQSSCSKTKSPSSGFKSPKPVSQSSDYCNKKVEFDPVNISKSIKYLDCFERLYQSRPVRLCAKKPKLSDKVPKTIVKKKSLKDSKSLSSSFAIRDKKQVKSLLNKKASPKGVRSEEQEVTRDQNFLPNTDVSKKVEVEDWLMKGDHKDLLLCELRNEKLSSKVEGLSEGESESEVSLKCSRTEERKNSPKKAPKASPNSGLVHSVREETLVLKLLQEIEEIKNHIRMSGGVRNNQSGEKTTKECQTVTEESCGCQEAEKSAKNAGLRRLEEKFYMLKEKYDQQMEKLEAENENLKELLSLRQSVSLPQRQDNRDTSTSTEDQHQEEIRSGRILSSSYGEKKITRSVSLDNCKAPTNSPVSGVYLLPEESQTVKKDAFSQTENDLKNVSIQCCQEVQEASCLTNEEETIDCEDDKKGLETRKVENKENMAVKKKVGRTKPFSDMNIHQLLKQKKAISDHETQLLATLRGLQAELTVKDKENRKLKAEVDLLKTQMKKLSKNKGEGSKKCQIGTQTIGLGPVVQKPYDPTVYEATDDLEKENEELKSKLRMLEDGFELLKEKRISDLQTLHQVHQEEMAKLVSRLETQSALTKHFHSLLINH